MKSIKSKRKRWYKYRRIAHLRPLQKMCGDWRSNLNSPSVRIFRTTQCYHITVYYRFNTSVTKKIKSSKDVFYFDLFGFKELAYDEVNDILLIAEEGRYVRNYSTLESHY